MITLYPLATPIADNPMPVFPLVGSIIVAPFLSFPSSSASRIICIAIRSLTEPAGLKYSIFAKILPFNAYFSSTLVNSMSGVLPTNSTKFLTNIFISYLFSMIYLYSTLIV